MTTPTPDQPRPDMTFTVGDRVWVSAEGTDGGDAGYATLIAIRENGTCDLRDDNGAEYWSLLSHLSRVDQPRPDAAGMTTAGQAVVMHITRSQVPALSDAICRGIEHIEQELADLPEVMAYTEEREGLANDFRAMLALRDDLQRQANAALAARQGEEHP